MHLAYLTSLTTVAFHWLASGFTQLSAARYYIFWELDWGGIVGYTIKDLLTRNRKTKFPTIYNDYIPPNMP